MDGIDVLLIGSFDLTSELGIPGQMGHQKLIDAYATVAAACRKHGKVLGMGGINGREDAERYVGMGARYLGSGTDHSYIMSAARDAVAFYRGLKVGDAADPVWARRKRTARRRAEAVWFRYRNEMRTRIPTVLHPVFRIVARARRPSACIPVGRKPRRMPRVSRHVCRDCCFARPGVLCGQYF